MEQGPSWEASSSSASQEISSILWNQAVHHSLRQDFPPVAILKQICLVQAPNALRAFLLLFCNLLLGLPCCHLPICFSIKTHSTLFFSTIRATCPAQLIIFTWSPNNSWWGIPVMNCSLYSLLQCLEWFYLSLLLHNTSNVWKMTFE